MTRTASGRNPRCILDRIVARAGSNVTPELLMTGAEKAGGLIAVGVTRQPKLTPIEEYPHGGPRGAHRTRADGSQSVFYGWAAPRRSHQDFIAHRQLRKLEVVQGEHAGWELGGQRARRAKISRHITQMAYAPSN